MIICFMIIARGMFPSICPSTTPPSLFFADCSRFLGRWPCCLQIFLRIFNRLCSVGCRIRDECRCFWIIPRRYARRVGLFGRDRSSRRDIRWSLWLCFTSCTSLFLLLVDCFLQFSASLLDSICFLIICSPHCVCDKWSRFVWKECLLLCSFIVSWDVVFLWSWCDGGVLFHWKNARLLLAR